MRGRAEEEKEEMGAEIWISLAVDARWDHKREADTPSLVAVSEIESSLNDSSNGGRKATVAITTLQVRGAYYLSTSRLLLVHHPTSQPTPISRGGGGGGDECNQRTDDGQPWWLVGE